ncbi:NlpC/P60 family protein [Nocardia panacis]|uniref:NlpC/P60 family protein n=1 Tax=Nocardia panacis TaxID=2340916 RepID=UPI001939D47B|nr:NlpC/P60 family protein [Nocardia panacis]
MIDIDLLVKPLTDLLASFGAGVLPSGGAADSLRATAEAVDQVHAMGRDSINAMSNAWQGEGADAATSKALRVQTSAATISDRGNDMATLVDKAAGEIASGNKDLTAIVESFLQQATSLGPALGTPEGLAVLVGSAIDHLQQGVKVVNRVQGELDTHTSAMSALTPPPTTSLASTLASSVPTQAIGTAASGVQQLVSTASSLVGSGVSAMSGLMQSSTAPVSSRTSSSAPTNPGAATENAGAHADTGTGVKITLPDGSEVTAPNEKAATAVRAALGAVGTPYAWGGTTPGVGLDCSGLTKCSYEEAGLELPRLANQQALGSPVSPGDLAPGDLAVWDGHVAMVIGNGKMVEAGDPVSISSIRTENIGMDFYGFYRPTA